MENEKWLIDVNALMKKHCGGCPEDVQVKCKSKPICISMQPIVDAPAVEAIEVVHGRWEYGRWEQGRWVKGNERCRCSVCHRDFAVDNQNIWHGCPQCFARMDGEE